MTDPIFGVIAKLGYDFLKLGIVKSMEKDESDQFRDIFNDTVDSICKKYGITSKTDLETFLESDEMEKEFRLHEADMDLNIEYLSEILEEYINLPQGFSYKVVLMDLFKTMQLNMLKNPKLEHYLNDKRFYILRKDHEITHQVAVENQEILKQILTQTERLGISLKPDDFENNIEFFCKVGEILKEDPYYTHDINLSNRKITYKLIPKNEKAQEVEPIRMLFTIILEEKDGKIITLDEMIEESSRTGEPIIFDSDSIKEATIYRGDKPLHKNKNGFGRIELRPIVPEFPVRILVPGSDSSYDVVLQLEQRKADSIIVSNQKQDMPIKFKFEIAEPSSNATNNYNIHVDFGAMDVIQSYKFLKFIRYLKESRYFVMKDLNTGKVILNAKVEEDFADMPTDLDLIKKLAFIQEVTGVVISMPLSITRKDIYDIEEAYALLRDGKIERDASISNLQFSLQKEYVRSFIEKIGDDGLINDIRMVLTDYSLKLLAIEIPIKKIEFAFSNVKFERSKKELKKELDDCKEDSFMIKIKPIGRESINLAPK